MNKKPLKPLSGIMLKHIFIYLFTYLKNIGFMKKLNIILGN